MDFFTFDDVAIFGGDDSLDSQGIDYSYSSEEVTNGDVSLYETQVTVEDSQGADYGYTYDQVMVDGTTFCETQVTGMEGQTVYDEVTIIEAPAYGQQVIVNDTSALAVTDPPNAFLGTTDVPGYADPIYTDTTTVTESYSSVPTFTTPIYDTQSQGVSYDQSNTNPGCGAGPQGNSYYLPNNIVDYGAQPQNGLVAQPNSTTQAYSNTSYQVSAQVSVETSPVGHPANPQAQNGSNLQPQNAATTQQPLSAAHQPVSTAPAGPPMQRPSNTATPQPRPPIGAASTPLYPQLAPTTIHGNPQAATHAVHPSLAHVSRPSFSSSSMAHSPVVHTLVTKPIGSIIKFGRKPSTQALMQNMRVSHAGGTVMNMVSSSIKAGTDLCTTLVTSGNLAAPDVGTLAVNGVTMAWKAGAYAYHSAGMKKQLAICLHEYCMAGHLHLTPNLVNPKQATWTTTNTFHHAKFLLQTYKDIQQYIRAAKISEAEMDSLGWKTNVTIHTQNSKVPNIVRQLSTQCNAFGIRDPTKSDLETRLNVVSFPHIGLISLTNSFLAESNRRRRRELQGITAEHHLVPVLGRVISLAAICGIREICLSDITLLLGKAVMFEGVARARIAGLRKHHASHVINTLLWGGSTQSAARDFAQQAMAFNDQRMAVGTVVASGVAHFHQLWKTTGCVFTGTVDADKPVGTPVYMLAGMARLCLQREVFTYGAHPANTPANQPHSSERDVHGNVVIHPGTPGQLQFTVKTLVDGSLMAKPKKFDRFEYFGSSSFNQGRATSHATGEEKHFGGIIGPVHCGCTEDQSKGQLTQAWRYSEELEIMSRRTVMNSIQHTKDLKKNKISILWSSGDWAKGVFLMQTLVQSSYLQGRGECLHCAVENAALAGCPEVIACGGGKISAAARRMATATVANVQAANPDKITVATSITQHATINPVATASPPPAYTMTPPAETAQTPVTPPLTINIAPDKPPMGVATTKPLRRKPIGSAVVKKPLMQATVTEILPDQATFPQQTQPPVSVVVSNPISRVPTTRKPVRSEIKPTPVEHTFDLC